MDGRLHGLMEMLAEGVDPHAGEKMVFGVWRKVDPDRITGDEWRALAKAHAGKAREHHGEMERHLAAGDEEQARGHYVQMMAHTRIHADIVNPEGEPEEPPTPEMLERWRGAKLEKGVFKPADPELTAHEHGVTATLHRNAAAKAVGAEQEHHEKAADRHEFSAQYAFMGRERRDASDEPAKRQKATVTREPEPHPHITVTGRRNKALHPGG